jgi:hypothetical protein
MAAISRRQRSKSTSEGQDAASLVNAHLPWRRGVLTIARMSVLPVAAIPSMLDELFDRSGFVKIKLLLLSFVERQLGFQRSTGFQP